MKKYIDYGKLLEERHMLGLDEMSRISKINAFNHFIDTMPSTDVAEVVHGKWIKASCSERDGNANCSVCNHWDWDDCNYCSNCGAKIDKE